LRWRCDLLLAQFRICWRGHGQGSKMTGMLYLLWGAGFLEMMVFEFWGAHLRFSPGVGLRACRRESGRGSFDFLASKPLGGGGGPVGARATSPTKVHLPEETMHRCRSTRMVYCRTCLRIDRWPTEERRNSILVYCRNRGSPGRSRLADALYLLIFPAPNPKGPLGVSLRAGRGMPGFGTPARRPRPPGGGAKTLHKGFFGCARVMQLGRHSVPAGRFIERGFVCDRG